MIGNAIGHVCNIDRAEQRAPPALAIADKQVGSGAVINRHIGKEIDPQPRRAAGNKRQVKPVVLRRNVGEHSLKFSFEQLEPGDLAIAAIRGEVDTRGLVILGEVFIFLH